MTAHTAASESRRTMETRDFIWLAALGSAARAPVTVGDVRAAIDRSAGALLSPVGQVIEDAVADMVCRGNLSTQLDGACEARFASTAAGQQTLARILGLAVPLPSSAMGQVAVRLKLAFVDLLPPWSRKREIDALIAAYEDEVIGRRLRCQTCPVRGTFGQMWFDHDLDLIRRELALLRRMAELSLEPSAAIH